MIKVEADSELDLLKALFDDTWILDQSKLSISAKRRTGVCVCLGDADLIVVKASGSFWICKDCLYGDSE